MKFVKKIMAAALLTTAISGAVMAHLPANQENDELASLQYVGGSWDHSDYDYCVQLDREVITNLTDPDFDKTKGKPSGRRVKAIIKDAFDGVVAKLVTEGVRENAATVIADLTAAVEKRPCLIKFKLNVSKDNLLEANPTPFKEKIARAIYKLFKPDAIAISPIIAPSLPADPENDTLESLQYAGLDTRFIKRPNPAAFRVFKLTPDVIQNLTDPDFDKTKGKPDAIKAKNMIKDAFDAAVAKLVTDGVRKNAKTVIADLTAAVTASRPLLIVGSNFSSDDLTPFKEKIENAVYRLLNPNTTASSDSTSMMDASLPDDQRNDELTSLQYAGLISSQRFHSSIFFELNPNIIQNLTNPRFDKTKGREEARNLKGMIKSAFDGAVDRSVRDGVSTNAESAIADLTKAVTQTRPLSIELAEFNEFLHANFTPVPEKDLTPFKKMIENAIYELLTLVATVDPAEAHKKARGAALPVLDVHTVKDPKLAPVISTVGNQIATLNNTIRQQEERISALEAKLKAAGIRF